MSRASALEQQMLDLINEERTTRGLEPVALELRLNDSSEAHSQWMLEQDQFSHTGVDGTSAGDRMRDADFEFDGAWSWGENIAYQSERGAPGLADDVEDLHNSLMNSPGHRANILDPGYDVVGLGIETGDFDGFDAVMVTQNFASTDAELDLDRPGGTDAPQEPVADAPEPTPDGEDPDTPIAEGPDPEADSDTIVQTPVFDPGSFAEVFDDTFIWDGATVDMPSNTPSYLEDLFAGVVDRPTPKGDGTDDTANVMTVAEDGSDVVLTDTWDFCV